MSALTRIFNNQIYNATIVASQKIAPGTITGSLFSSNVTVPGDLLIAGNLFVLGSSAYTTIASTNTYVNDPLITLNNGFGGTNTYDEGLVFNRGTSQNQAFIWNEFNKEFRLIGTTETGTTYGNVVASSFANLHVGNIGVDYAISAGSLTVNTAITASSLNLSGNLLASTVGASFLTASTAAVGNISAVTMGNVGTQFNGAAINLSGNVLASTVLASLVTAGDGTFGNVDAGFVGNTGTVFTGASINVSGNVLASTIRASFLTASTVAVGNISAVTFGNVGATFTGSTASFAGDVSGGLSEFTAINNTPIGNATASTGAFTTLTASGIVELTDTSPTTGIGTGALRVAGGTSISGNLYVGGNLNVVGNSFVITSNAGVFYGDLSGFGALYAGTAGYTPLPATVFQSTADLNGYVQNNFENLSLGPKASTDWVATAGDGTDITNYIDMGIVTANWDGTQDNSLTNAVGANDGYLYVQGNVVAGTGGNLTIGASTTGTKQVKIIVGGNTASYIVARFNNPGTPAISATSGVFTVTGGVGIAGNIYAGAGIQNTVIGNVTAAAGYFTTLNATGYFNAAGNISTPQLNAGQINTTGNVLATAGVFNALTINGNESVTGYLNVTGNVLTAQLDAGQINTTGNVLATGGVFNGLTVNGNESVTGYLNVSGNILGALGILSGLTVNGNESVTGYLNVSGNVLASTLGASYVTASTSTFGNISAALIGNAGTVITGLTGAFSGNVIGGLAQFAAINATPIGNATASSGAFTVLSATNNIWANASIATTTQGTGAIVIPNGGISVAGAANIAGATTIGGATQFNNTIAVGGISTFTNTTNAIDTSSGAVKIAGGASVSKDLWVGGNIYASNIFGVTHQVITVQDPLVYFDAANTYPYNYDIGFYSNFVGPNPVDNTGNVYQHSGVVRDNADNTWKFFSNVRSEPAGTAITFDSDTIYDPVRAGNLTLTYTQSAISTTTGALQVAGGAGIAGTVVAGQINSTGNILGQAGTFNALTINGNESVTGYLNVTGNVMTAQLNAGQINTTGNVVASTMLASLITANDGTFGNVDAGFVGNTGTVFTGASINLSGNILSTGAIHNSLTVNGNELVTGYLNVTGNVLAATGVFGAITSTGYINTSGNISAAQLNAGQINTTGNVLAATVEASFLTASTVAVGNISAVNFGNASAVFSGASINLTGNVLATGGIFNSLTVNGNESVTGNLNVTGNVLTAQLNAGQINTTGNVLATAGVFNTLTVNGNESITGYLNVTGNVITAQLNAGQINTTGNVLATAGVFNGLTVNGNESVTGYLNVTGNVMTAQLNAGQINTTGNVLATTVKASFLTASTAAVGNISAVTIGNSGATVTGTTGAFSGNVIGGLASFAAINNTPVGNATASTGSFTDLRAANTFWANASTDTTTTTTGAIVVPNGGISIAGNAYIGNNLYLGELGPYVGSQLAGLVIAAVEADPTYIQVALQNLDNRGSSDYAAYASDSLGGVDGWVDMGFTGNAFSDAAYTITKPHDGYVFVRSNASNGGNLVLATSENGLYNDVIIGVGSFLDTAEVARFHGNVGTSGNAWIKYQTVATTPNTGALRVDGGVGIRGNIRVGGGAVINNSQTADPFQVKGVATTSLIYADTAQGAVIVGGSNTAPQLGSTLKVNGTDSLLLPIGSTGQRPGATGNIDIAGMIRFNTTINNMEFYDGSQWQTSGSVFTVISDRQFSGNTAGGFGNVDGTNTDFTIQANSTTAGTIVSINGVLQFPTLAYSVSGTTLTFTEPPAPNDVVDVRVLATTSTIGSLANGNGLQQFIASDDAAEIWTGVASTTKQLQINKVGDVEYLTGGKTTYTQTPVNITANNTPYVIATWSQTAFVTAKYVISAKKGTSNFQSMEALVTTDQAGNAYITTYAVINNGTDMGGLTANVVGGNVQVYWTTTTNVTNANVKAMGTYIV